MENKRKIVHLDDHRLFIKGVQDYIIQPNFPEVYYIPYNNTDEAFYHITSSLINKDRIDLLITDLTHPGLDGYEFAEAIRGFQYTFGGIHIPILLLTFHSDKSSPLIEKGLSEKVFDKYLHKEVKSEEIVSYIRMVFKQG